MEKPQTNKEAWALVLTKVKSQASLARSLHIARQLVSRWEEVPPKYVSAVAKLTKLPPDWILPELWDTIEKELPKGRDGIPNLVKLIAANKGAKPGPRGPRKK